MPSTVCRSSTRRLLLTLLLVFSPALIAEKIRIVTWNVRDAFTKQAVLDRKSHLVAAAQELKPDILLVQEVVSQEIAETIRDVMKLNGYHVVCSDFAPDKASGAAFEVAVISKFPIAQAIEYDPTPEGGGEEEVEESTLEPPKKIGIAKVPTARGFLWAHIPEKRLTIIVVHLKSSVGKTGLADKGNAEQREYVAAAVAASVNEDQTLFPEYAYLVAGDFNVGHSDPKKNGRDLKVDCYTNCGTTDLYDDTHALLSEGLVGNLRMRNLLLHVKDSTYPGFPGSPIDNIYVAGQHASRFAKAEKALHSHGSDHLAVWTVYDAP